MYYGWKCVVLFSLSMAAWVMSSGLQVTKRCLRPLIKQYTYRCKLVRTLIFNSSYTTTLSKNEHGERETVLCKPCCVILICAINLMTPLLGLLDRSVSESLRACLEHGTFPLSLRFSCEIKLIYMKLLHNFCEILAFQKNAHKNVLSLDFRPVL